MGGKKKGEERVALWLLGVDAPEHTDSSWHEHIPYRLPTNNTRL